MDWIMLGCLVVAMPTFFFMGRASKPVAVKTVYNGETQYVDHRLPFKLRVGQVIPFHLDAAPIDFIVQDFRVDYRTGWTVTLEDLGTYRNRNTYADLGPA